MRSVGIENVSNWVYKNNVDVFLKNILMIPIYLDAHWSLMSTIIVSTIDIYGIERNSEMALMIHLDPADLQGFKVIAQII